MTETMDTTSLIALVMTLASIACTSALVFASGGADIVLVIVGVFTSIALWSLGYLIRQDAGGG